MENAEANIVLRVIKDIETNFADLIAFAYIEENGKWWNICISDYSVYCSDEFKEKVKSIRRKYALRLIFSYRNPDEKILLNLAEKENLVLNL